MRLMEEVYALFVEAGMLTLLDARIEGRVLQRVELGVNRAIEVSLDAGVGIYKGYRGDSAITTADYTSAIVPPVMRTDVKHLMGSSLAVTDLQASNLEYSM